MDPVTYPCSYEGGFAGMRGSNTATLELTDELFSVTRKRSLWSKTFRVWAKWTAVVGLAVIDVEPATTAEEGEDESEPSARVMLTTKARGMGAVVVPGVTADELWEILDQIGDLAERFHHPPAPEDEDESGEEESDEEADDESAAG